MIAQKLNRVLKCYRIGDDNGAHPIFDAIGSTISPGRWNRTESAVIYTSEHYSTAMLEKLVHLNGKIPANQHFIEITLPNGLSFEMVTPHTLPGWEAEDMKVAKDFGTDWQKQNRSAILIVPSLAARMESNIVINPSHPEFSKITHSLHTPIWWDARLFTK
ncbi:MAG: RES domain-containing protein [Alphaproteobacteria bacterium]